MKKFLKLLAILLVILAIILLLYFVVTFLAAYASLGTAATVKATLLTTVSGKLTVGAIGALSLGAVAIAGVISPSATAKSLKAASNSVSRLVLLPGRFIHAPLKGVGKAIGKGVQALLLAGLAYLGYKVVKNKRSKVSNAGKEVNKDTPLEVSKKQTVTSLHPKTTEGVTP